MKPRSVHSDRLAGFVFVATIAAATFFVGLGSYPLLDPDEARHAEIAREMAAGDGMARFLQPTYEERPYREKPPGFYWLVTVAYGVAGVNEWAARAVSASAALATVLALHLFVAPRLGVGAAVHTGLVAVTTFGWLGLARVATLDMTFTACITIGVLGGLAWLERARPRGAPWVPYVAMGVATLVKGPLALLLVAGPLLCAAAASNKLPRIGELRLVRGAVLTAALAGVFWLPAAYVDPGYLEALASTHLRRLEPGAPHEEPFYYYALWLPVLTMPWTPLAVPAIRRAWRSGLGRAALVWVVFVPALMTLARGKLATYALPAMPPIALLVGSYLATLRDDGLDPEDEPWVIATGWLWATALVAGAVAACVPTRYPLTLGARAALAIGALLAAAALVVLLRGRRLAQVPPAVAATTMLLVPVVVLCLGPALGAVHSMAVPARLLAEHAPDARVVSYRRHAPSLVFYRRAPSLGRDHERRLRELFAEPEPTFVIAGHRHFSLMEDLLGPRASVWWDAGRVRLYGNRPPP